MPLLLVMGLASQMLMWETDFCELLAARGFRVIRYDNRDVGQSTILRGAPTPKRWQLALRDPKGAPYSLQDMAGDAVGLLDHLQIPAAHVVGASMGGMIAQALAIGHPDRVLSLVSIMSTTGNRRVGRARPRLALRMLRRVAGDRDGYIRDHIRTYREIGSPAYSFDEATRRSGTRRLVRGRLPGGWWRWDGPQLGHDVGPDEQDPAGRVVDDKAGRGAEAPRAEPLAVSVAGQDDDVDALSGGHDLALDTSASGLQGGWPPEPRLGFGEQLLGSQLGDRLQLVRGWWRG